MVHSGTSRAPHLPVAYQWFREATTSRRRASHRLQKPFDLHEYVERLKELLAPWPNLGPNIEERR